MTNEFIAKIEGHGQLEIDWKKGEVDLHVFEGERLFEGILVGRTADEMAWITPRICGVCPTAHNLASLGAIENAYGIKVNQTTVLLRQLMNCGQMIQSHALHLFFLSLPDYLGIDRGTELAVKNPKAFADALMIKESSDGIVKMVGGRIVHPMRSVIGGFNRLPTRKDLESLLEKLKRTEKAVLNTVELCAGIKWLELKVDLELVALDDELIISVSSLNTKKRKHSLINDYKKDIEEEVKEYSTAKFGKYKGKEMFVGSLARLAINKNYDEKIEINFANPFYNNLAQGLEVLYYYNKSREIIEEILETKLDSEIIKPSKNPPLYGIGSTEAPRGGLYHEVHLDKEGIIKEANIITPTVQNLTSMEKSAQALIKQSKNRSQKEIERLLIMLIRAYDPCITCSVH